MRKRHCILLAGVFLASFVLLTMCEPRLSVGQENAPAQPNPNDAFLEAVGTMGSVQLYQTYLNIGFIADGKGQKLYSDEDAQELLASVVGPLDRVTSQFQKVKGIATDEEDKKALDRLSKIADMLKKESTALKALWASGANEDADRFEKTRQQVWNELRDFLRLDPASQPTAPEVAPLPTPISK